MRESLTRCPGCQSVYLPEAAICATCGRVLAASAPETIPIDTAPALETIPMSTIIEPAASTVAALFPPLLEGQSLAQGRYTIQRPLSRGGMGALTLGTVCQKCDPHSLEGCASPEPSPRKSCHVLISRVAGLIALFDTPIGRSVALD